MPKNKNTTCQPQHRIIQKDVTLALKDISENSVDIIIADPPYNIGKDFGECKDRMEMEAYVEWCKTWIADGLRVLKPNGSFFIYGFSEILAHILVSVDCDFKRWLVWHYTNKNSATANIWQRSHESILLLSKEKPNFNRDSVREPYTETYLKNSAGKTRAATESRFGSGTKTTIYNAHSKGALPRDVLKNPALAGGAGSRERAHLCKTCNQFILGKNKASHNSHELITHPTQKPIDLTRRLIASAKVEGNENNVLVFFNGSGAESVAAVQEGCNVIGFDINPDYIEMSKAWLAEQNGTRMSDDLSF